MLPFTRPTIGDDEIDAVVDVLKSKWITTGPKVGQFESALAEYIGPNILVRALNSGTAALEVALAAAGIGPGDEVIVPAFSFAASANVIMRVGAEPVFVDVDLHTRNISIEHVTNAITPKTRAILPVHFAGLAVDMDPIHELAKRLDIVVIEDAAHAIGTTYKGRQIGSSGNPVCFSFHPNKNITTIEGGALACSDTQLIRRAERLRFHGIERDANGDVSVVEVGGKYNLPDINAALGLVQLPKLDAFNNQRRQYALGYLEQIDDHPALLKPVSGDGHSWHMFCICIDFSSLGTTRQEATEYFKSRGISLGYHYPAIHLFPLYRSLGHGPGDFPNAERIGRETVSLPLFPDMTNEQQQHTCKVMNEYLAGANT